MRSLMIAIRSISNLNFFKRMNWAMDANIEKDNNIQKAKRRRRVRKKPEPPPRA